MNKVFISYATEDYEMAKRLYDDLKNAGAEPWLDREDLLPGQNWRTTIPWIIRECRYFLLLISKYSVSKQGYVQKEQKIALEILDEFPSDEIFVIPVRLDNAELGDEKIRNLQCADLSVYSSGFKKILKSMSLKAAKMEITMTNFDFQREKILEGHLESQLKLLNDYERKKYLDDDPRRKLRYEDEIAEINKNIDYYKQQLSELREKKTQMIEFVNNDIDSGRISEAEMTQIVKVIQQAVLEITQKSPSDSKHEIPHDIKEVSDKWNVPDITTGGRLKFSIPIIPTLLTYEGELSVNVKESLKGFWGKCWKRLNQPIF